MESLIGFFEKLVSEFSWRRVGMLVSIIIFGIISLWAYESFTGQFRSARMQFATEQLTKLADPDLRKNVQGDSGLEKAYDRMKSDLIKFLEGSKFDLGLPEPILRGIAATVPWFLLALLMFTVSEKGQFKMVAGGLSVAAIPFVVLGMLLPTFEASWINYFLYPFGSVLVVVVTLLFWQKRRSTELAVVQNDTPPETSI